MRKASIAGRAALKAGPGDQEKQLGPSILTQQLASITWQCSTMCKASTSKPSRSTSGLWPSREQQLGPEHPDTAPASTTWQCSTMRKASMSKPNRSTSEPWRSGTAVRARAPRHGNQPQQPGTALRCQGKYEQAEPLYQRALAIREQQLGPEHPTPPPASTTWQDSTIKQGRYAEPSLFQRPSHLGAVPGP